MSEPTTAAARICSHGHVITDPSMRACPACGVQLPRAEIRVKVPSLAPAQPRTYAPKMVPFLLGGIVLVVWGSLLTFAAEHGPAEFFGWFLLVAGVGVAITGIVEDLRHR